VAKQALKVDETLAAAKVPPATPSPKQKLPALLVTADESLWSELGNIGNDWVPKQLDSVDELVASFPAGQPAVVLWDARGQAAPAAVVSRLQLHSDRLALIALDSPDQTPSWTRAVEKRQLSAHVPVPLVAGTLSDALTRAREDIDARVALLGVAQTSTPPTQGGGKKSALIIGVIATSMVAAAAAFFWHRQQPPATIVQPTHPAPERAAASNDDKVDSLIERAQRAMLDRRYLEPANGSALSLFREALILDPTNGEATQGLQRLAGILITKVQSALDEHKFDVALQSLETARSIRPDDSRLAALDARIASVRNELGTTQIQAALNAQNFDRASQLIDEAALAKAVPAAKLAPLRDELHHRREQTDLNRLVTLIDARLQQDRLVDPRNDNAGYYLSQARDAGAPASTLQPRMDEFVRRAMVDTRSAIDQHRFADADRYLAELHNDGTPAAMLNTLQHDLAAARAQPIKQKVDTPPFLDLARSRLSQGRLVEPDNDSALYYVNQLRATDPQNAGLAQVSGALQAQLVEHARAALNAGDTTKAESLLRGAGPLGSSADVDALNARLSQAKSVASGPAAPVTAAIPEVLETSLKRTNELKLHYPHQALMHNVEGWVELSYTVTSTGKVADPAVIKSSPPNVFDEAGVEAVKNLRYQPFLRDGNPIAVTTKVRLTFRLTN